LHSSLIIVLLGVCAVVALVWFYTLRKPTPDPFINVLNDRFRGSDDKSIDVQLKCRVIAWLRTKSVSSLVVDQWGKIGADDRFLYFTRGSGRPVFKIPLNDLVFINSRFFWGALLRFDVYEIVGIETGKLLIPVGFLGAGVTRDA
jgi:hypothetical protein